MQKTRVLIIGAGPYGVAVAGELYARGIDFVIAGEPFDLWQRHTLRRMRLRSACAASEIYSRGSSYSLSEYLDRENLSEEYSRTPVTTFRRYLDDVVERLPFPITRELVTRLERRGDGFEAELEGGERISAGAVVVATGIGSHRHLPPVLADLPRDRVLHSWDTEQIDELRGRRVLVIGVGQSAAETVDTLRDGNRVTWAMRHEPLFWGEPLRVPTPLFKSLLVLSYGFYRSPTLVRMVSKAAFRTTITPTLEPAFADAGVEKVFSDAEGLQLRAAPSGIRRAGDDEPYDVVVSATGYRFSPRGMPFLSRDLVEALGGLDERPTVDARFQSPVEKLYLVGGVTEQTFGPAMRFIFGSYHTARRIGRVLSKV